MSTKEELHLLRERKLSRFIYYYLKGLFTLAVLILLCEYISMWFYVVSAPLIGILFFRLALLGHEGTHGLICKNRKLNDFIGRYLCHFPAFTSHSKYTTTHLMHHRFLGSMADIDRPLYRDFPVETGTFFKRSLVDLLTLKTNWRFLKQVTELTTLFSKKQVGSVHVKNSDLMAFILYWTTICMGFAVSGSIDKLMIYWFIPHILTIPYVEFVNALQHAPIDPQNPTFSRNLKGEWFVPLLLPININLHASHHKDVRIPFYNLTEFEKKYPDREQTSSFAETLRSIFKTQ